MSNKHQTSALVVWPVRPNIDPFKIPLSLDSNQYNIELSFPPIFEITSDTKLPGNTWSQIRLDWEQSFDGSDDDYKKWLITKGARVAIINRVIRATHCLIDYLKITFSDNRDVASLRHFGYRDWPIFGIYFKSDPVTLLIGPSAEGLFRTVKTSIHPHITSIDQQVSFAARTLCRAADLSETGYPTEAALLAFAVLDSTVQQYLADKMRTKGISKESIDTLLRNVTQRRLKTYLGPILKLIDGRSLEEDNVDLFADILKANKARNDAIHNGVELSTEDSIQIIDTIYETLIYLSNDQSLPYLASIVKPFHLMNTL